MDLSHLTPGPPRARAQAPTIYCYICGRQFGSRSIDIHQPQCLKKWRLANEKLPKSQRRPEPAKPEIVRVGDAIDYTATNAAAYEASLAQLVKCEFCGRKFAPERLHIHHRSCSAESPAAPVGALRTRRNVPLATTLAVKIRQDEAAELEETREQATRKEDEANDNGDNGTDAGDGAIKKTSSLKKKKASAQENKKQSQQWRPQSQWRNF